jgi:hypothetical protein
MIAYKALEINQLNRSSKRYLNQMKSKRKKGDVTKNVKNRSWTIIFEKNRI